MTNVETRNKIRAIDVEVVRVLREAENHLVELDSIGTPEASSLFLELLKESQLFGMAKGLEVLKVAGITGLVDEVPHDGSVQDFGAQMFLKIADRTNETLAFALALMAEVPIDELSSFMEKMKPSASSSVNASLLLKVYESKTYEKNGKVYDVQDIKVTADGVIKVLLKGKDGRQIVAEVSCDE